MCMFLVLVSCVLPQLHMDGMDDGHAMQFLDFICTYFADLNFDDQDDYFLHMTHGLGFWELFLIRLFLALLHSYLGVRNVAHFLESKAM